MIKLLVKTFVKDSENTGDKTVRQNYSILGGVIGAVCNIFLFVLKLVIGTIMNSIAITSDAFNNLSDMGSCVVAIIGAKMANRLPDREHPFGHGRFEYVSSLIVSFIIMLVGFELFKGGIDKIRNPEEMNFSIPMTIILAASVLVKMWMFFCYNHIAKKINSSVMKATAQDSINDVISTSAVIVATVIGYFLPFQIDGFIGVIVSILIMYSGFNLAKDTIDLLLGTPPSRETIDAITTMVLSDKTIVGTHDLIVHDYGPGRVFASVHAEVPDKADPVQVHEVVDEIERKIFEKLGIMTVIHTDPIAVDNEYVNELKEMVYKCVVATDSTATIHDFRITDGENRINLIFDMVISSTHKPAEINKIADLVKERIRREDERFFPVITVDEAFHD